MFEDLFNGDYDDDCDENLYEDVVYWLWLQHAFGPGSDKPVSIYKRFENLEEFYNGGRTLWATLSFISEKNLASLESYTREHAEAQIEYAEKADQIVIGYSDYDYPEKLKNIDCPPAVLFTKGKMPDFDNVLTITVVGSRDADKNDIEFTRRICYDLSKQGVIIVSGGAIGIDAAAHKGALQGTGINTCVLPCGLDYPYLMQNQIMRNQILHKGGCLISEYPMNTCVYKGSFQVRNRIMSALSNGVLVVKAKKKSGTMITVSHATKQDKDIFAVPGDVNDPNAEGTNLLIRDGATPVLDAKDILGQYSNYNKIEVDTHRLGIENQRKDPSVLSENTKLVYLSITNKPLHISKICEKTGMKIAQVQACITELELLDYIKTFSGQRCSLK